MEYNTITAILHDDAMERRLPSIWIFFFIHDFARSALTFFIMPCMSLCLFWSVQGTWLMTLIHLLVFAKREISYMTQGDLMWTVSLNVYRLDFHPPAFSIHAAESLRESCFICFWHKKQARERTEQRTLSAGSHFYFSSFIMCIQHHVMLSWWAYIKKCANNAKEN